MKNCFHNRILIIVLFFFVGFWSCREDFDFNKSSNSLSNRISNSQITLQEAKLFYDQQICNSNNNPTNSTNIDIYNPIYNIKFKLLWGLSYYPEEFDNRLIMVPILDTSLIQNKLVDALMCFSKDSTNTIHPELMIFIMDSSYYESQLGQPSVNNYTGFTFNINDEGALGTFCHYINGEMKSFTNDLLINEDGSIGSLNSITSRTWPEWLARFWRSICGGVNCYDFGGGGGDGFFNGLWNSIRNFFNKIGQGNNGGSGSGGNGTFNGWGGFGGTSSFGGYGFKGSWGYGNNSGGESNQNTSRNIRDYFSELQIKQFTAATKKLNTLFNCNCSLLDYALMGLSAECLELIAKFPTISIEGLESLPCLNGLIESGVICSESGCTKGHYGLTNAEWEKAKVFENENEFMLLPNYISYVKECSNSSDFEKCIITKLLESVNNPNPCQGGRKQSEEVVDCHSFNFIQVGSGQIACIEGLRVWRTHPITGMAEKIGPFCFSVTLPYITFDNQIISKGQAQECAAWALNDAAGAVDALQVISTNPIPSFLYIKMIQTSFLGFLSQSSCTNGIKTIATCNSQNCTNPINAIYMSGCGWNMSESDYGCK